VGKRKDKARLALDVNGRGKRVCSGPAPMARRDQPRIGIDKARHKFGRNQFCSGRKKDREGLPNFNLYGENCD